MTEPMSFDESTKTPEGFYGFQSQTSDNGLAALGVIRYSPACASVYAVKKDKDDKEEAFIEENEAALEE